MVGRAKSFEFVPTPAQEATLRSLPRLIRAQKGEFTEAANWLDNYCEPDTARRMERRLLAKRMGPAGRGFMRRAEAIKLASIRSATGWQPGMPEAPTHRIQPRNQPYARLAKAIDYYQRRCLGGMGYSLDLTGLSDAERNRHARRIVYVTWLAMDPDAHKRGIGLSTAERVPFDSLDCLGRGFARAIFGHWEEPRTGEHARDRSPHWWELFEHALAVVKEAVSESTPTAVPTTVRLDRAFSPEDAAPAESGACSESRPAIAAANAAPSASSSKPSNTLGASSADAQTVEGDPEQESARILASLQPGVCKAYAQYLQITSEDSSLKTDPQAHAAFVNRYGEDCIVKLGHWCRNLSTVRKALGTNKYQRGGAPLTRSIRPAASNKRQRGDAEDGIQGIAD